MQPSAWKCYHVLFILLAGLCLSSITACTAQKAGTPQAYLPAVSIAQQAPPCTGASCPNLVVTQSGKVGRFNLSAAGFQAAAPLAQPKEQAGNGRFVIDTGSPSPDGQWVAYTTVGRDSGGPVLLQKQTTGEWTNLVDAVNARLPKDQPIFPQDAWWDVIGWFPDSARLMIGPTDLSQVLIVDLATFTVRGVTFPGSGRGGRLFAGLAPDGSRFIYVGEDTAGNQVLDTMDLATGKTSTLLALPYTKGVLYNPRYSPDQQQIAYLLQNGRPDTGLTYSISLLSTANRRTRVLVEGNLGPTVPVWSPDGSRIAFTKNDGNEPYRVLPDASPPPQTSNVWVVSISDGKLTQVTFASGQLRSPVWAKDSRLLAFVTNDGQVQMADITQPGSTWQVAGPSTDPELTSLFFLP